MTGADHYSDCRIRVRYAETDQMAVAYYGNYFAWFEVGRAEFCRQRGFSYAEMERRTESFLVVAEARCRYCLPLRYDQEFVVRTRIKGVRSRSITFTYELLDPEGETVYAEGETIHVVTDRQGKPRAFPEPYRKLLAG